MGEAEQDGVRSSRWAVASPLTMHCIFCPKGAQRMQLAYRLILCVCGQPKAVTTCCDAALIYAIRIRRGLYWRGDTSLTHRLFDVTPALVLRAHLVALAKPSASRKTPAFACRRARCLILYCSSTVALSFCVVPFYK